MINLSEKKNVSKNINERFKEKEKRIYESCGNEKIYKEKEKKHNAVFNKSEGKQSKYETKINSWSRKEGVWFKSTKGSKNKGIKFYKKDSYFTKGCRK